MRGNPQLHLTRPGFVNVYVENGDYSYGLSHQTRERADQVSNMKPRAAYRIHVKEIKRAH